MPVVHEYANGGGFYLRANIDGRFVTFQMSPGVEGLIRELDYTDEDEISWQFLQPLCEHGHVYTNNSGTEISQETIDAERSVSSGVLTQEEERRLEEFLNRNMPQQNSSETSEQKQNKERKSVHEQFDEQSRWFIEKWTPSEDEYEATLNRLARTKDIEGIRRSVAHHGTEHPISPSRFQISSRGTPVYSYTTLDIPWAVYDFRFVDKLGSDVKLFIEVRPGTRHSQSITIEDGISEWHTAGDCFTQEQIDDLVSVFPDIAYYVVSLPAAPTLGTLVGHETADIPTKHQSRVEALDGISQVDPEEYGSAVGVILSYGEKGYGRIRAQTGNTFNFSEEDFQDDELGIGDFVSFGVESDRDVIWARDIHREVGGIDDHDFLQSWPVWREKSINEVRDSWEKPEGKSERQGQTSNSPNGKAKNEEIEVEIDPLGLVCLQSSGSDGVNSVEEGLEQAVRLLLKQVIDGEQPKPLAPADSVKTRIRLPGDLLSLVDTVIETSTEFETRSQLINSALQQQYELTDTETKELTFRLPQGYYTVLKRLTDEQDTETGEFARDALKDAITREASNQIT